MPERHGPMQNRHLQDFDSLGILQPHERSTYWRIYFLRKERRGQLIQAAFYSDPYTDLTALLRNFQIPELLRL